MKLRAALDAGTPHGLLPRDCPGVDLGAEATRGLSGEGAERMDDYYADRANRQKGRRISHAEVSQVRRDYAGGAPHGPWPIQYECHACGTIVVPSPKPN